METMQQSGLSPAPSTGPRVPHYYGDRIREIFLAIAVLSIVVLPLWDNVLPLSIRTQLLGALLLVFLAGLTNPHSKLIMILNVCVAGIGAFLYETTAIYFYDTDSIILFMIREIAAILFLFALYFGVKSARSMLLGIVGHTTLAGEFDTDKKS